MKNTEIKVSTDLKKFITKFEPAKFKMLTRGIEIRGIYDIHRSIELAKALIESMKLKLVVNHSAEMAQYRSFEVLNAEENLN
nr:hypothetical protein [Pedobacter panaciterrae]